MKSNDVLQVYTSELQELRSVEAQLVKALPKMAQAARHPELKQAFNQHLEETRSHQQQVETILRRLDAEPREHVDQAMQAIIREANPTARDAPFGKAQPQCPGGQQVSPAGSGREGARQAASASGLTIRSAIWLSSASAFFSWSRIVCSTRASSSRPRHFA